MRWQRMPSVIAGALALTVVLCAGLVTVAGGTATPPRPMAHGPGDVNGWPVSSPADRSRAITIIESQSQNIYHDMDLEWQALATGLGHSAAIVGQNALDDIASLESSDILIVASGLIALSPERIQTIRQFVESHGPAYLQGEFSPGHPGNVAFIEIVGDLGGSFALSGTASGDLQPMTVLGSLATHPNAVPTLPYFWYGCAGTGDSTIEYFLEYQGDYFGWIFVPPRGVGRLIHTTDQDWAREADERPESAALMENILTYLDEHADSAVEDATWGAIKSLFR